MNKNTRSNRACSFRFAIQKAKQASEKSARTLCLAMILIFVSFGSVPAQSPSLALDFTGEGTNGFLFELSLGWSFEVTQPVRVEALGFFDHFESDENGLSFDHRIRLWTDDENPELLASSAISNDSLPVPSAASNGRWLFNEIMPVLLLPGNYIIGADDPPCTSNTCDRYRLVSAEFTIPEIIFGEARSASPPGPPQSAQPQLSGGYFGPTMMVSAIILGDVNGDGVVNLLDVAPFVDAITEGNYIVEADVNLDGIVDLLDVQIFVSLLVN